MKKKLILLPRSAEIERSQKFCRQLFSSKNQLLWVFAASSVTTASCTCEANINSSEWAVALTNAQSRGPVSVAIITINIRGMANSIQSLWVALAPFQYCIIVSVPGQINSGKVYLSVRDPCCGASVLMCLLCSGSSWGKEKKWMEMVKVVIRGPKRKKKVHKPTRCVNLSNPRFTERRFIFEARSSTDFKLHSSSNCNTTQSQEVYLNHNSFISFLN